jgi:membrane protein implicated in regulation of membrane protease activity
MTAVFADEWLWVIFVGFGFLLIIAELFGGVDAEFDLVVIGGAFILGGLIGLFFGPWLVSVVSFSVVSVLYFVFGRRYMKRWTRTRETKTNVDALMGRTAIVVKPIAKWERGRVKIDGVTWRASAEGEIAEGVEVAINGVKGSTLLVSIQGGV